MTTYAPVIGETIWFHQWETDHHVQYSAIVRAAEIGAHKEVNLNWYDEDGNGSQANNVKNIEQQDDRDGINYWRKRSSNQDISELSGLLETVRVERGEMVLYRPWDSETHWTGGYFAACVITHGLPADPHPVINLRYIDSAGTSKLVPNLNCIEQYTDEDEAEGNDLWSNIPSWAGLV